MNFVRPVSLAIASCLPDCPPWNMLPETSVETVLAASSRRQFGRGDVVDATLGVVTAGALALEHDLADGRRSLCPIFHGGELVDLRRTERVRVKRLSALKPSVFLILDADRIDASEVSDGPLATAMAQQRQEHYARLCDHVTDLVCKTPIERLASLLIEFRRWPESTAGGRTAAVRIPIQRNDIADHIGVTPETVSRALRQLERERLIGVLQGDWIALLDVPSIHRIANGGRPRRSKIDPQRQAESAMIA